MRFFNFELSSCLEAQLWAVSGLGKSQFLLRYHLFLKIQLNLPQATTQDVEPKWSLIGVGRLREAGPQGMCLILSFATFRGSLLIMHAQTDSKPKWNVISFFSVKNWHFSVLDISGDQVSQVRTAPLHRICNRWDEVTSQVAAYLLWFDWEHFGILEKCRWRQVVANEKCSGREVRLQNFWT